jgi:MtN3 and saliva related transmembrane protein
MRENVVRKQGEILRTPLYTASGLKDKISRFLVFSGRANFQVVQIICFFKSPKDESSRIRYHTPMSPIIVEWIGGIAATLTTLSWLPQALRTLKTRDTSGISLLAQVLLFAGIVLWLIYGLYIVSWPLIISNIITFVLVGCILAMKLRHG